MKLIVTEKNIAAKKLAEILAVGKVESDKVYNTPVYRFRRDGEDWVSIGLKGHILGVDFPQSLAFKDGEWLAVWDEERTTPAPVPATVSTPPWESNRKPFTKEGVELGTWRLQSLPYLVWAPIGKTPVEKELIRSLKNLAKKAEEVVIATDYDREGELIGSDARAMVRDANGSVPVKRARFSAITKGEIESAFENLGEVENDLAAAGEARQDIDLVWGAVLTRYLTKVKFSGVGQPRSAGRVQTPTLKLIVDREKERKLFVPEDYWVIKAKFASEGDEFEGSHAKDRFKVQAEAQSAYDAVQGATEGRVAEVTRKTRKQAAPTPFNTTALQAAAASEGLSPARTMRIAETLYMNGLISYPRVDNTVYPSSLELRPILKALSDVAQYRAYAKGLLAAGSLTATRGAKETTDHPPIHPTGAADPDKLKPEEWKLYNLVARRFMATLSGPATIESTKAAIDVAGQPFVAKGDVIVEKGFREIYPFGMKKDEQLPKLADGQTVSFLGATLEAKQTQPPARFSEGGIIQEMEKRGLGTKATRHSIVETLMNRKYVQLDEKALKPTMLGEAVIDALTAFAERITTPDMTAELEAEMDDIAKGKVARMQVVEHSRELLAGVMDMLLPKAAEVGELMKDAATFDAKVGVCKKCGSDLLVKASPKTGGQFVGCSAWPECDVTYPLPQGRIDPLDQPCPLCGTPQVKIIQFRQRPKEHCLDPQCPSNVEPELDLGPCPTCKAKGIEGRIISRKNPRTLKRYARCTNYEECGTSYPLPQNGELEPTTDTCEPCGAPIVVVHTRKGPWRICVDPNCPAKSEDAKAKKKPAKSRSSAKKGSRSAKT
ncbi:MAG: DNA topoisomerase I [Coriobacteriales bacterium]|nr:DNA topoisomerase I [Coriobacteriales bacterium]